MKINILVVDDRPEGLLAVEAVLASPRYNLVLAKSGTEALKYLLLDEFAVILMDVQMPTMNGFETAEIIKTREKSRNIPIIFMSAISQDEQYVYQGYGVGAVDYIMKPFDPYILKSKVGIFVELYQKNLQLMEQAQKIHESEIKSYAQALDRLELESLRKYQHLADSIPQIVFRFLPDGSHEYFNNVWFDFTGFTIERTQGQGWREAIHPEDFNSFIDLLREESQLETECRILSKEGEYRWHLVRMKPEKYNDVRKVDAWLGTATDIEERKRNESYQHLMAKAGEVLVASLDSKTIFQNIANLVVDKFADGCRIEIINENCGFSELAIAKKSEHSSVTFPSIEVLAIDESQTSVIQRDAAGNTILVPMISNGRTLGALSFHFNRCCKEYELERIRVAEELGLKCAMGLENSLLYDLSVRAIEIRNDFLSIASHELNTPITSLKLHLQLVQRYLSEKGLNDQGRFQHSVEASIRQVDRLIGLIQILLDVSKIQSGKFNYTFSQTSLHEIIHDVIERNRDVISSSGCKLIVSNIPDVSVKWDKLRIEQVIINLLMNAVKYAPGRIELNLSEDVGMIKIEVKDYGKGIQSDKIDTIFDRFSRATKETISGLGLGLFIVKQIVEGHGGEVTVLSSDKGSSFKVALPTRFQVLTMNSVKEIDRVVS